MYMSVWISLADVRWHTRSGRSSVTN